MGSRFSNVAFAQLLKRMKADQFAPHGLRSAFRDWAGDLSTFLREVAGQALVHRVGESTELAYRRAGALEKRLKLMAAWQRCTHLTARTPSPRGPCPST